MHMHAIGATEEITLVELDIDPQEENQEVQHQDVPKEVEPKTDHLPECPDHQPATFVKGKPQSIISLPTLLMSPKVIRIDALRDRSCLPIHLQVEEYDLTFVACSFEAILN